MREICTSGSTSGMWKRNYGAASKAPPHERGGQQLCGEPKITAPHLDSTDFDRTVARIAQQRRPTSERIADGTGKLRLLGEPTDLFDQPGMQVYQDLTCSR
jgi:hypothetical protein